MTGKHLFLNMPQAEFFRIDLTKTGSSAEIKIANKQIVIETAVLKNAR